MRILGILVHHIHTVDLILPLRPPGWPCNAGLVSGQRSVSDLYIARSLPGQRVHVMSVSERLLTERIALEHSVNLLQQWRYCTSLQSLSFEIILNTLNVHCSDVNEFHVLFSL